MYEEVSREAVIYISVSEFVFMTTIFFLETARDGVHCNATNDWILVDRGSVLVPLRFGNYDHISRSSFLSIVKRSDIDPSLALM